jgi:hypothetical protein
MAEYRKPAPGADELTQLMMQRAQIPQGGPQLTPGPRRSVKESSADFLANMFGDGGMRATQRADQVVNAATGIGYMTPAAPVAAAMDVNQGLHSMQRGNTAQGAAEIASAALPLASRTVGESFLRRPLLKQAPEEAYVTFKAKDGSSGYVNADVSGRNAVVTGAYAYGAEGERGRLAGHTEMSRLFKDLRNRYPYVENVYADRISGMRNGNETAVQRFFNKNRMGQEFVDRYGDSSVGAVVDAGIRTLIPSQAYNMAIKVKPGWQK